MAAGSRGERQQADFSVQPPKLRDAPDFAAAGDGFVPGGRSVRKQRRAHGRRFLRLLDHLRAVDDVADIALEITEERQPIPLGLDEVVDFNSLGL